jgi:hypothetical protein
VEPIVNELTIGPAFIGAVGFVVDARKSRRRREDSA